MSWYYYSGTVVRPIPIKKGLSIAVRPKSKVEIFEKTLEVRGLIRKKLLRLTSKPKKINAVGEVVVKREDVVAAIVPHVWTHSIDEVGVVGKKEDEKKDFVLKDKKENNVNIKIDQVGKVDDNIVRNVRNVKKKRHSV